MAEIGVDGTSFQRVTSAGAVARQLPYICVRIEKSE